MWLAADKGGGVSHQPDVHKTKQIAFWSLHRSSTPPPHPQVTVLQYISRFGRFYARYNPDVCGRGMGVVVCQADDDGQGRMSKK